MIFNTQTDWLKTDRTGDGLTNEDNDLHVTKAALSFSPQYEYSLRDFVLRAEVPVRGDAIWRGGDMTEYFPYVLSCISTGGSPHVPLSGLKCHIPETSVMSWIS